MGALKAFLLGSLCALTLFVVGWGADEWSRSSIRESIADFDQVTRTMEATPRVSAVIPVTDLQRIQRSLGKRVLFPTAMPLRSGVLRAMEECINADLLFMADSSNAPSVSAEARAKWALARARAGLPVSQGHGEL